MIELQVEDRFANKFMRIDAIFDPGVWAAVPFHFWSLIFFVFGTMVGSFLNVCIHRMPRNESIISPPSHCPTCNYQIPWYLNIPLVTWIWLRGRCARCGSAIAARYFLVELLTGLFFLACWLRFGGQSPALALVYCLVLAGFIAATFIDFEHFVIPDEITLGGIGAGFICSFFVPALHNTSHAPLALRRSILGIAVGAGVVYLILRAAKVFFGRHRFELPPDTTVIFGENGVRLPDREIPYEELFYRKSDAILLQAKQIKMGERTFENAPFRLAPDVLRIGEEVFKPEEIKEMEVVTDEIVVPREAMGLGDVKFMGAIGAFLGWKAVLFSLMVSSMLGALAGVILIVLRQRDWSSRIPYGPYIAAAATIWIFGGQQIVNWWFGR